MVLNAILRQKARAALKPMMPVVILCALIANLPSLLSQTVIALTGSDPMSYLLTLASTDAELVALLSDNALLLDAFRSYFSTEHILSQALSLLSWFVSPVLMLGLTHSLLMLLRSQEIEVKTVFGRLRCFIKSILLNLLMTVKMILWGIPGGLVMVAAGTLAIVTGQTALLMLYMVGMGLTFALMIRAMLHYAMANTFMADAPGMGVRACLKASITMMRQRKMALLSLLLSVYVWQILLMLAQSLLSGMFGNVIASTVSMAGQLFISVYMQTCQCAFYEAYREKPQQ